jgi:hypothetical protein
VGVGPEGSVPEAAGVVAGGVALGVGVGRTEALGVGRPVGLTLPLRLRVDVDPLGRVEPEGPEPVDGALVAPPGVPPGFTVAPGVGVRPGATDGGSGRSAAIAVPTSTSSTSPIRATSGSERGRRAGRTPPVPGGGSGRAAVVGSKSEGPPGGVAPDRSAPLGVAVPGCGSPPLPGGTPG